MRRHPTARDIERRPLDLEAVRALPAPAVLRNDAGRLFLWTGQAFTRADGTLAHVDEEGPWQIAAAPVDPLVKIMERRTEVSGELDLRMMLFYGRDVFAESLDYGNAQPIPYRGGQW